MAVIASVSSPEINTRVFEQGNKVCSVVKGKKGTWQGTLSSIEVKEIRESTFYSLALERID